MLLQNTLDLSTFEIVRFRIWNQTSQPSDRGFGSKYFNTNSGHEAYCREEIFTPIGWRTAAYMDDIDKINEKLDLIFGDELDTDTIIDSWKEVQDFLSGIEDTKNLMTMLDGKVDHVINMDSSAYKTLGYGRPDEGWRYYGPAISFGTNTYFAQIQVNHQADQIVFRRHTNQGFSEWQTLIHSGNALDQLKGTFLPLTGGTINGTGVNPLNINTTNKSEVGLYFNQNNTSKAWVGYTASGGAGIYDVATKSTLGITIEGVPHFNKKTLLHSGNVGDYTAGAANHLNSTEVSGEGSDNILDDIFTRKSGISVNIARNLGSGSLFVSRDTIVVNYSWGGRYGQQWAIEDTSHKILVRTKNADQTGAVWSDWKTIAFTDSDITGNAATATKLKDKVSLWGNEFDGTKSLDNNHIYLANQRSISWKSGGGAANIEALVLNNGNDFLIGQGVAKAEGNTYIYGNNIKLCYGTAGSSAQTAMTITNGGNVNIGAVFDDFKFSVYGGITFLHGVESSALALGQMPTNGLLVGNTNYGIGQWFQGGQGHIQVGRFDGTATAYALNLNPLGGAVNIGEGGLNVAGNISLTDAIESNGQEMLRRYDSGLYLGQGTAVQGGLPTNIFGKEIRFLNSGGTRTLVISDEGVASFSNRVLIGGAADDGTSALQVKGLATFNGGALIPTGQTLTIGSVTIKEVATGEIEVNGNLHTTGTLASGGKAKEGTGGTGGASGTIREFTIDPPTDNTSSFKLEHSFNTEKVIVQIFELNGNSGKYEMILTDVEITDANNVTVTFGRKPTEYHKVYVMA